MKSALYYYQIITWDIETTANIHIFGPLFLPWEKLRTNLGSFWVMGETEKICMGWEIYNKAHYLKSFKYISFDS